MARTSRTRTREGNSTPHEENRKKNKTSEKPIDESVKCGTSSATKMGAPSSSSAKKTDGVSSRNEARAHRGSGAASRQENSPTNPSNSALRSRHSERNHQGRRSHESRYSTSDRDRDRDRGQIRGGGGSGYDYNYYGRSRSQNRHGNSRRYMGRERNYHQSHDNRSWRRAEWHDGPGSSRGGRDSQGYRSNNYYPHDDDRYRHGNENYSHRENHYDQDHSRISHEQNHDYGNDRGRDDYYASNPDYGPAPSRDEHQTHHIERGADREHISQAPIRDDNQTRAERRTGDYLAPAQNEHQFQPTTDQSHPVPALAPPRQELSGNKILKLQLEREELETKLARTRLEKEQIHQQLSQMKNNDPVLSEGVPTNSAMQSQETQINSEGALQAEGGSDSAEIAHNSTERNLSASTSQMDDGNDDDVVLPRRKYPNSKNKTQATSSSTDDDSDDDVVLPSRKYPNSNNKKRGTQSRTGDDSEDDAGLPRKKSPTNNGKKLAAQSSMHDDSDDDVLPRRKSPISNGKKRCAKPAGSASRKKKINRHKTRRGAKLSKSNKRKFREARMANDEGKKHELLKAYEEDLEEKKSQSMHCYTEKDLMSRFIPDIIDHHLMPGGQWKFLVEWNGRTLENTPVFDDGGRCLSWISHEDFLFPALARGYLKRKINNGINGNDETAALKLWMENCEERERCLNCLNTFGADTEFESHLEIDFCCFQCKCPWDHPLKRTIRNCEEGLKFHRGCCHQYQDLHDFESTFVSPIGKIRQELLKQLEENEEDGEGDTENENDAILKTPALDENVTQNSQKTSSVITIDGDCEKYLQCIQSRSTLETKRDGVVVCINAGVGSGIVSLKHLGIKVTKVIHVEADQVAQHVIRSNHDYCYGETAVDDQIEHITGLYNTISDVAKDTKKLVQKYGPIDMIMCNSPQEKSKEESVSYANDFFEIVEDIERSNIQFHNFDCLFYLLESPAFIKGSLLLQGRSYCLYENLYVCNWPISSQKASFQCPEKDRESPGLPTDYVTHSVRNLYDSLLKALCVGLEASRWRDETHPKFWPFLSLGPTGYDVKLNKGKFGPEAFALCLRNPENSSVLSEAKYSTLLLQRSSSVKILLKLLEPTKKLFKEKMYGSPYNVMVSHQEEQQQESTCGTGTQEHGGIDSPNSLYVASGLAPRDSPVVKREVKEEYCSSTDEED